MGGHYGTIHVRTDNREPVRAAVESLAAGGKKRFLIAPPLDGWVTVFPSENGQDSKVSKKLAKSLADKTLIHCLVHDDDVFAYWLYEGGDLVDAYDSCPGYFSGKKMPPCGCNPEALRHLLPDVAKIEELSKLLKAERFPFELERQDKFAALLGLPHTDRAYEYLQDGETDGVRQWKQFIHVPDLTVEKAARRAAAAQERAEYKQLQRDGLLLVSEVGKKSSNKHFYKSPFWVINPSKSEVFLKWSDYGPGSTNEPEWFCFASPHWRGEKAVLPPIEATDRLSFSSTGAWLLTSVPGSSRIDLRDTATGQITRQKQFDGNVAATAFSADERWLFVVVHHYPPKTEIHRLALRPELKDAVLTNDQLHFAALVPHPSGKFLAAVDNFGVLVVVDVEQMRIVQEAWIKEHSSMLPEAMWNSLVGKAREKFREVLKPHQVEGEQAAHEWQSNRHFLPKEAIRVCEFSPDGDLLLCGTVGGARVLEWKAVLASDRMHPAPVKFLADVETATIELRGVSLQQKSVMGIAYDAPRQRVLFCGMEGKISFVELENGKRGDLVAVPEPMPLFHMVLTRDRTAIAVTGQRLGATSNRDTPGHFQIWSYSKLCQRAGLEW
jgi:hypothetical protein